MSELPFYSNAVLSLLCNIYQPDHSLLLRGFRMSGIAVKDVGCIGGLVMLPSNKLDQISVGNCGWHFCHAEKEYKG